MTEELQGIVKKIIFSSDDGRFCVFILHERERNTTLTVSYGGHSPHVGQKIFIRGCWVRHPRFGMQFKASSLENIKPEKADEIKQFLSSGLINGIGPSMAERIIDQFGSKTLDVLDNHIERLKEVRGIGQKTLDRIQESYMSIKENQTLIMFLQSLDIPEHFAADIQNTYGSEYDEVLTNRPYRLIKDIPGLGFREVDRIAKAKGISAEDPERILQGINFVLMQGLNQGHACIPEESACHAAARELELSKELVLQVAESEIEKGRLPVGCFRDIQYFYLPSLYHAETESALFIKTLLEEEPVGDACLAIEKFERENHLTLAEEQKEAVKTALNSGIVVITGGPGTGKTTLVRAIITAAGQYQKTVKLMAPTGRAAKRLGIASGVEADTIHKALEAELRENRNVYFNKNDDDPLEEDIIIVDEASMMDITLFHHLSCALKAGSRLVLVGDVDQLPPIGPGYPLRDLISSEKIPVVKLQHVFRQKEGSGIIENAIRIREGNICTSDDNGEFEIYYASSEADAFRYVIKLCDEYHYGEGDNKMNLQVLSPMYRGMCGVDHLNESIQAHLHQYGAKREFSFYRGDKVMQMKNDYEKGVYNGDIGIVWAIEGNKIFVHFFEREVVYEGEERNSIHLAYASTIHKSQGSEYNTVIMILLPTQSNMFKRNLLYTGVTRAKKKTILISTEDAIQRSVMNGELGRRYSLFLPYLKGEAQL